jgi:uncharacterized protein DUF5671
MAIREELLDFVKAGLTRGLPRAQIEGALLQAGWDDREVKAALAGFADVAFPLPVPRPKPYLSAREAFTYLVLFSTLYVSAYGFGSLLFQLINHAFPDPTDSQWAVRNFREAVRWSVSSLIVAFPVFLYVSRWASQGLHRDPTKRSTSKVRRWLTYLTLFMTACILLGTGIALVNGLLAGELTVRFALKVLTVAGITGTIFGYYLWDLRAEEVEQEA